MKFWLLFALILFSFTASSCAMKERVKICHSEGAVAAVEDGISCDALRAPDYSPSTFDLIDPLVVGVLAKVRSILARSCDPAVESSDTRNLVGDAAYREMCSRRMNSVYEVHPDFANTLSRNTFTASFLLEASDRVTLMVDAESAQYYWGFWIE